MFMFITKNVYVLFITKNITTKNVMFITKNFAHLLVVITGCATLQVLSSLFKKELNPGSAVKNLPANAGDTGDMGSTPGWERPLRGGKGNPSPVFPGGGNDDPLQCSSLDNPTDRGAW